MNKIYSVQYLRGIAALIVVISHSFDYRLLNHNYDALRSGRFGVLLFFLISGFIMVAITGKGRLDPLQFLVRRFLRVVPLYWIMTTLVAAAAIVAPHWFKNTQFSTSHYILSLLFVPHETPGREGLSPMLSLGWTLNYEIYFYIVFSALFFLSAKLRVFSISLIFTLLFLIGEIFPNLPLVLQFYTDQAPLAFCFGAGIGLAYIEGSIKPSKNLLLPLSVSALCLTVGFGIERGSSGGLWVFTMLLVSAALILIAGLRYENLIPKVPALQLLGDSSYSIYLAHMFVVGAFTSIAYRFLPADALWAIIAVTIGSTLFSIAGGLVVFFMVERPLVGFFNSAKRKPVANAPRQI